MLKVKSVKNNYILSVLRIISGTLVGVFTMPYINRVLGPESLGKVEYVNTIINYFILFSALGIPMYGVRQIAKVRDNKEELSKSTFEILGILLITSLISYIVLFGVLFGTNVFLHYQSLIILMSSMILLSNLGTEWFFQGVENQVYITIRYVAVRLITVVLLFLLVKSEADYMYYALIVILNFGGSSVLNFLYLRKYISLRGISWKDLNFKRHIKPSLTIFVASISISIYLQIDNFLLGYLAGDKYVGYYSTANKLLRYVITFITTIGSVLMPRLVKFWQEDREGYYQMLNKAFEYLLLVSIPFSLYFYFFAEGIILLMGGEAFALSIQTLKILSPICVLVAMAYFFGFLVLYPQNKEKVYTISISVAAFFSMVINWYFISLWQHNGAAVTQVLSELIGLGIMFYFVVKNQWIQTLKFGNAMKIIFGNIILLFLATVFSLWILDFKKIGEFIFFILYTIMFFVMAMVIMIVVKEENVRMGFRIIRDKIGK